MIPMFINCALVIASTGQPKIIDTGLTRIEAVKPVNVYRCERVVVDKSKPLRRVVKL